MRDAMGISMGISMGKCPKIFFQHYNHLANFAELHCNSSFQGYPACPYFLRMVRWPYDHKWPNMAKMAIYGHMAIALHAKNMDKWGIPKKNY